MQRKIAERVVLHIEEATKELNEALILTEKHFSKEDFDTFRRVIAQVLVELQADALKPVYDHFRDLDKYGYSR